LVKTSGRRGREFGQDGDVPSWRPESPGDPDDADEWRFTPLDDHDPALAAEMIDRYGRRWLRLAGLPAARLTEVPDTVELRVADDWHEPPGADRRVLRLTSWYTGSTYWLREWDGARDDAMAWVEDVADLQAHNVHFDRRYGTTPWDPER